MIDVKWGMFTENVPDRITDSYVTKPATPTSIEPAPQPEPEDDCVPLNQLELRTIMQGLGKLPLEQAYALFLKLTDFQGACKGCQRKSRK